MKTSAHNRRWTGHRTRRWSSERTVVLPEAGRVVAALRRDGITTTSVGALTGDGGVLDEVLECARALVEHRAREVTAQRTLLTASTDDPWARPVDADRVRLLDEDVPATSCRRLLLHPVLDGVAEAYCRRAVRTVAASGWLEVAATTSPPPRRWERGPAGRQPTLEVWILLTGAPDGGGPLHYVSGSHHARRGEGSTPGTFEAPGGPAGTVVLADPRGMHRRSPAVGRDRLLLHGSYSTRRGAPRVRRAPCPAPEAYALAGG
ncbi:hypothetical protein MO973_38590 [Paenibacillus sp. TRM 82003]|uniref:hypothetical protein n=1 Tax=Kineococcus sp. TRM81007 TaxID=2925831 RepID=UPI001F592D51|nr:hypothetical protein [Kineococcus sp. TRM81007]MCI2239606.1 hypothetical protein [Kineococcus sp. TRM81007]MCI3926112.1 hypothetical protein [Paenibacillus sp. TRM 82003]